jgi:ribonucleoside-diphosphate reductase alpha chain
MNLPEGIRDELIARYKTAFQVNQFKLLDAAAARGVWIDQAMSVNLFNDQVSLKYLNDMYMHAWTQGLKTTYYLRNKGASSIEKASVNSNQILSSIGDEAPMKACLITDPTCESCQ